MSLLHILTHRLLRFVLRPRTATTAITVAGVLFGSQCSALTVDQSGNVMDIRVSSGGAVSTDGPNLMFNFVSGPLHGFGYNLDSTWQILPLSPDYHTVPVACSQFTLD